jgi:hypothetical protein
VPLLLRAADDETMTTSSLSSSSSTPLLSLITITGDRPADTAIRGDIAFLAAAADNDCRAASSAVGAPSWAITLTALACRCRKRALAGSREKVTAAVGAMGQSEGKVGSVAGAIVAPERWRAGLWRVADVSSSLLSTPGGCHFAAKLAIKLRRRILSPLPPGFSTQLRVLPALP